MTQSSPAPFGHLSLLLMLILFRGREVIIYRYRVFVTDDEEVCGIDSGDGFITL